jgi:hypothetical protein
MSSKQPTRRFPQIPWMACFVAISWFLLSAEQACADAFAASLEYSAVSGCPDDATFKGMIKAELGHDPFRKDASEHILVHIARRGSAVDGRIEWRDSSGNWVGDQVFHAVGKDCGRVARTAALALALQIQLLEKRRPMADPVAAGTAVTPDSANASPTPKPDANATAASHQAAPGVGESVRELSLPPTPPAALPERAPSPEPTSEKIATAAIADRVRPVFAIGVGTSVGFGMSSNEVFLGRLVGSLDWPSMSVELAVEADRFTTTRRSDGAGVEQQRLVVGAATCMTRTGWRGCVVANIGEVRLVGDIDRPASASVPIAEVGARVGFVRHLGDRFFTHVRADALANLNRWTATLDHRSVWTAPRFAGSVGVDVGISFR